MTTIGPLRGHRPLSSGGGPQQRSAGASGSRGGGSRRAGRGGRSKVRTPTAPMKKIEKEEAELEKQYIWNLQQQVYYLELEMQYLREKEVQQAEGAPLPDEVAVKAAPLEAHMKSLKLKYVEQEKAHENERKQLEDKLDSQEVKLSEQHFTIVQLRGEIEALHRAAAETQAARDADFSSWSAEKIAYEKRIEDLEAEVDRQAQRIEDTGTKLDETASQLSEALLRVKQAEDIARDKTDAARKAKKRYDDLVSETEAVRVRIVELEEERSHYQERIGLAEAAAKEASDGRWKAEIEAREARLELDQNKHALAKAEADSQAAAQDNVKLQGQISDLQRDNHALRFELDSERQNKDDNKTRRIEAELRSAEITKQNEDLIELLATRDAALADLETQNERKANDITQRLNTIANLEEDVQGLNNRISDLDVANSDLRHDKAMLQNELSAAERGLEERDARVAELNRDNAKLNAEVTRLAAVARVGEDMRQLNIGEFESMMTSNFQVAHGLSSLLSDLKALREMDVAGTTFADQAAGKAEAAAEDEGEGEE